MREYIIAEKSELTAIADAIRTKTGNAKELSISDMATEIEGLSSTETLVSYVVGTPIELVIPADAWSGTHCTVKAIGYQDAGNGLYLGLPAKDSTTNTNHVIKAALTMPSYAFTSANTSKNIAAYTTLTISAIEAPKYDVRISVIGFKEVDTLVKITDPVITGVSIPVTGQSRTTSVDCDQFTGDITWSPNNSTFQASTKYTATITLTPKAGYTLSGVASNFFTVEGASSVRNSSSSGVVTAVFPTTATG